MPSQAKVGDRIRVPGYRGVWRVVAEEMWKHTRLACGYQQPPTRMLTVEHDDPEDRAKWPNYQTTIHDSDRIEVL